MTHSAQTFTVYSVNDPAIERQTLEGRLALQAYVADRDETKLVLGGVAPPIAYHLRPLPFRARTHLQGMSNESLRHVLAFRIALESVDGLATPWDPGPPAQGAWDERAHLLSDSAVERLAELVGALAIEEVGSVALQRANLAPHQKKAFWLPLGCAVDWAIVTSATTVRVETSAPSA